MPATTLETLRGTHIDNARSAPSRHHFIAVPDHHVGDGKLPQHPSDSQASVFLGKQGLRLWRFYNNNLTVLSSLIAVGPQALAKFGRALSNWDLWGTGTVDKVVPT